MANIIYTIAKEQIFDNTIDLEADTFRVALLESSANQSAAHVNVSQVITADPELTNVALTRQAISNAQVRAANTRAEWYDAGDGYVEWANVSQEASELCVAYLVYKFVTDDGASIPIMMVDSFTNVTPNGSDIRVTWNAAGMMHSG